MKCISILNREIVTEREFPTGERFEPNFHPRRFFIYLLQLSGLGFLRWSRVDIFLKIWCSSEKYKAAGFLKLCTTTERSRPRFWTENGWERTRERKRTRTRKRGKEKHLCEYFFFFLHRVNCSNETRRMFNIFFDKIVKICHWEETNLGSDKTFWLPPSPASTITSTSAAAAASSLAHKSCFAILSCLQKCCWVSYCFVPFVKLGNLAFLRWQIVLNAKKAEYGFWGLLKVTDSGKKVLWNAVPGFISLWSLFLSLSVSLPLSLSLSLSSFPVLLYYVYWCR